MPPSPEPMQLPTKDVTLTLIPIIAAAFLSWLTALSMIPQRVLLNSRKKEERKGNHRHDDDYLHEGHADEADSEKFVRHDSQ